MQLYNAKIRLYGSLLNEVRRERLTAAEVILLRHMHGSDAVVDIVPVRDAAGRLVIEKRSDKEERNRMAEYYTLGLNHMIESPEDMPGAGLVRKVFGVDGVPLPRKLDDVEATDELDLKPNRGRPGRPAVDPAELMAS